MLDRGLLYWAACNRKHQVCLCLAMASVLVVYSAALAQQQLPDASTPTSTGVEITPAQRRFILQSVWQTRDLLRSAEVRNLSEDFSNAVQGGPANAETEYTAYFDARERRLRLDTSKGGELTQVIRRPEWMLFHPAGGGVISKYAPDFQTTWTGSGVLDVRIIGMSFRDAMFNLSLEDLHEKLSDERAEITQDETGKYLIVWRKSPTTPRGVHVVTRMWCDPKEDYAVTRMELATSSSGTFPSQPDVATATTYEQTEGLRLPVECEFSVRRNGKSEVVRKWRCQWVSVNTSLPEIIFTQDGLSAPGGTLVADARGVDPLVESIIKRDGIDDLPGGPAPGIGKTGFLNIRNSWVLIVNAAIVVFALVGLILSRRARHSA
jgi:hypothetical protein